MVLSRFPRRQYTHTPTPIDHAPRFSKALAASCPGGVGPDIWIKRDDMLGLFPGGNKTRKLEFLAADALAQGADTLITCGAPQSNHCRITLAAAVKEGMRCQFVIEERVPGTYKTDASGNNFMFHLLGVENITLVPAGSNMAEAMGNIATTLQAQGRKGYIIPGGGSNALGSLGYVACVQEMQQQWYDAGMAFDKVIVGSGSSGTHGGMLAGFLGNHIHIPLIGIGVSRDPADQDPLVHKDAQAVMDLLGTGIQVPREAVVTHGGYWQPKYSVPNAKMVEAVQLLARTESILLDPVYTGKAASGMVAHVREGRFAKDDVVVFAVALRTSGTAVPVGRLVPLALVVLLGAAVPASVALYITAAYWFTASTSFANPAVAIARSLTNTFSGINPANLPAFIIAQVTGALVAWVCISWLIEPKTQQNSFTK